MIAIYFKRLLFCSLFLLNKNFVFSQTLVAGWDFQTTTTGGTAIAVAPATPTSINANFGNGNIYLNGTNGSGTWITATSGNQLTAFGGTTQNAGTGFSSSISGAASLALLNTSANGKSMVISFSMAGYANLLVSYATQRSGTGFTSQLWEYSTDAVSWTSLQTVNSIPSGFAVQNLNPVTALNNVANAYLRITFTGATGSSGNNRLDNIQLNATASQPVPVVVSSSASGTVDIPFSYFISANHSPVSFGATSLPAGLSINTANGEISGTPSVSVSSISVPISASNTAGTGNGTLTLSIAKANQTISFGLLTTKTYGDAPFTLTASGGASGNAISFVSSDPSVANISGNTVFINGAGTCNITASQSGNANYNNAADVTQSLTINQASQTISFSPIPTKLITDTPFVLNATGGASGNSIVYTSLNSNVATISGNTVTITGSGTTNITASQTGNINYVAAADVVQTLLVNKLSQTISFAALPAKNIGDPQFTVNATGGASGNPVNFSSSNPSVATISGNTVTIIAAGVTLITASQAGNNMYQAAADVAQPLVINSSSNLVTYTFGTVSVPTANATSGLPITNLILSAISQGNNANTSQTSINLTATSISNNSGASGEINAGITARNRNLQLDSSAYFEFTFSPSSGYITTLNSIQFGSRSTGTGPTTLDIRSSLNNYAIALATVPVLANSSWTLISPSITALSSGTPVSIRIYGYVNGGSGSINTGSSANNWRLDDVKLNVSVTPSSPCAITVAASASVINCNGGTSNIVVSANNGNGTISYKLNNNLYQVSNTFSTGAGIYTITVSDSYSCTASTFITITEPAAVLVTASNVTGCIGNAVSLSGTPSGGIFSVTNPYTGTATNYTYTYTDSAGCSGTSAPASISFTQCAVINLKLFLQSYYIGSSTMTPVLMNQGLGSDATVVDDIIIELRDPATFSLVATGTSVLHTNGLATISFPGITGNYYLIIKHRNSLQTWSANPLSLGVNTVTYDFSDNSTKAFGGNMIQMDPGVWAIYNGDINQDENIDLLDLPDVENDIQNFTYGYYATDLNGDGNIDLLDIPVIESNLASFLFSDHPVFVIFPETMENGSKSAYALATILLPTGSWTFDDALIGESASDRKNGAKSARIQNSGKLTMNFDVYADTALITILHAKYGSDANSTWALFSSINNGSTWVQQGNNITSSATSLQSASFVVNITGTVRFQIRKLSGGKLNIDDFNITANTSISFPDNDHIAMGNPSDAVTDISFPDNYLLIKTQYDFAYDNSKGTAAWVAWHLDLNDVGTTPRCDCFATDVQLPSSFYRAGSSSYSGSGFDRGHQVPSSHRNNNITNNATTFLMSNIMPQSPNLNQITWNNLEQYCISLINNGYELYTYSGGYGTGGTGSNGGVTNSIASGNINVPSHFWKIILILPVGNNDVNRVSSTTRVIAVDMPNTQTVSTHTWGYYRTSVDAIETITGFDFLKNVSIPLQGTLEAIVDNGPTN